MYWNALFIGMKNTEDIVFTQHGSSVDSTIGTSVSQEVNAHALSKALLRGELTEEVEQLRYRTYLVERESQKWKPITPTFAIKKDRLKSSGKDNKFISFDKSDGLEVITVQDCYPITEGIEEGVEQALENTRGKATEYNIKLTRPQTCIPRFKIEEFLKKLVVKKLDDTHVMLDMYVSKYPEEFFLFDDSVAFRSKAFIHEIERLVKSGRANDVVDFEKAYFVTHKAYKLDDLLEFEFDNLVFKGVHEFDGNYIIQFKARMTRDGYDLTKEFYNKTMDEKYKNKEKKEISINILGQDEVVEYVCADCGKVVKYDTKAIGEASISKPRLIDEEPIDEDDGEYISAAEYYDMQIVNETIGKTLCKKCLKKYIDKRGLPEYGNLEAKYHKPKPQQPNNNTRTPAWY